ncbi:MAG: SPFH domain-containing protein, partial [Vicinamibacterales bacterium]
MIRERERQTTSGLLMLVVFLALIVIAALGFIRAIQADDGGTAVVAAFVVALSSLGLGGLFTVAPNEGRVLQLFGAYRGTAKDEGLRWANPFYTKRRISLRVRNFESAHLKVNDTDGNPIEIAAIVVWRVVDSAEAVFEVDDYEHYIKVQTESAVRNLATHYPY